jgi:DNA-binding FrmR family transcriptional regulator
MKSVQQRLNNISGQIEGVKKMMDSKCDCEKVLIQLKAIRSAVSGIMDEIVEAQFCDDKNLLIKLKKYVKSN